MKTKCFCLLRRKPVRVRLFIKGNACFVCGVLTLVIFGLTCSPEQPAERLRRGVLKKLQEQIAEQRRLTNPGERATDLAQSAAAYTVFKKDTFIDSVFEDAYWSGCHVRPIDSQYHALSQVLGSMQIADMHKHAFELAAAHPELWLRSKLLCGVASRLDEHSAVLFHDVMQSALTAADADSNLIRRNEARVCAARAFLEHGDVSRSLQLIQVCQTEALQIRDFWYTPVHGRYGYGTARCLFGNIVYIYAKAGRRDLAVRFISAFDDEKMRLELQSELRRNSSLEGVHSNSRS